MTRYSLVDAYVASAIAPSGARYKRTRARGLAPWKPQRATRELIDQVVAVLREYRAHLPLTVRQIFYRLVGSIGYEKTERSYSRLAEHLVRARRAGMISFDAIRDDGGTEAIPFAFKGPTDFWSDVRDRAGDFRLDRQAGQEQAIEIWVEAGGMVPQVERVANHYGIPVFSSGGFDSLTAKHDAARRVCALPPIERGEWLYPRPAVILHIGDRDPSGHSVFDSAAEDTVALVRDMAGIEAVEFRRIVITEEQVERYALVGAPAKSDDKRGDWAGDTYQAEALAPNELADEVTAAIEDIVDLKVLEAVIEQEERERAEIFDRLERLT